MNFISFFGGLSFGFIFGGAACLFIAHRLLTTFCAGLESPVMDTMLNTYVLHVAKNKVSSHAQPCECQKAKTEERVADNPVQSV